MTVMKNKYRGKKEYIHVLGELVHAAQYRGFTTYQDLAMIMGLPLKGGTLAKETGQILGEISEDEVNSKRPMLSAVAINVNNKPGPGFFIIAKKLGRLSDGEDKQSFWEKELEAVYQTWRRPLRKKA